MLTAGTVTCVSGGRERAREGRKEGRKEEEEEERIGYRNVWKREEKNGLEG